VTVIGNGTFVHQFVSLNGYHTLTVFANDTSGNWATPQTVTYLVNFYPDYPPSPAIAEFPNWIIILLMAVPAVMTVYFRKHKRS
jgi:hypothetical protein